MSTKIAVIPKPPVLLDRAKTIETALESISEAAGKGASLLVFPEAYIPGYPAWIWRLKPGGDMQLSSEIHARLRANAVDLEGGDLQPLQDAAARHQVTIVVGINEIDGKFSGTTLFNTVVVIGPEGTLLNRHRKLMPTNPERMVWGMGDASGLKVVDTPAGRLGALICWESYMPLARYALYAQGIEIYIARPGTPVKAGLPRCGTSPRKAVAGWWEPPPPFRAATCPKIFPNATGCSAAKSGSMMAMPLSSNPWAPSPRALTIAKREFSTPRSTPRSRGARAVRSMSAAIIPGRIFFRSPSTEGRLLRRPSWTDDGMGVLIENRLFLHFVAHAQLECRHQPIDHLYSVARCNGGRQ